ncbi:MAG: murein biosynthesis integral membrane protein MurJ [Gemmatimonas sp.]
MSTTAGDRSEAARADVKAADRGGRAATVVGAGILLSRLTGLLRSFLFARYLGQGMESDAYNIGIRIPNFIRNLFGEGALSASFVPVYSQMLARGDEREANKLAGAILGLLMAGVSALTLLGIGASPLLTAWFAGEKSPEAQQLVLTLMRIMFPMTALMVLSGWCLGVQNSHRRFFWAYASAAMWNLAQIALLLGGGSRAPSLIDLAVWLAWATLAGSFLQVLAQMPEVLKLVRPLRLSMDRAATGVREVLANLVPVVTALGVVQISSLFDVWLAQILPDGAITSIGNANNIVLLPVSLFGISVAASSLPEFSRESTTDELTPLLERLRSGWQRILFYMVPSAVACIAYGDMIVGMLLRSGKFGADDQRLVHAVLAAFAVGLISFGSVKLLASAHYALKDYRTPLRGSVSSLVVSALISVALVWPLRDTLYGAAGIALGTALGSYVNLSVQIRGLRARLGALYTTHMWQGTRRIVLATLAAAIVAAPVRFLLRDQSPYIVGPPVLGAFSLTYLAVAWWMGSGEAARWLRRPVRTLGGG